MGEVALAPVAHGPGVTSAIRRGAEVVHRALDLVLHVVGQLRAGRVEELDAVVLGRVVRGGDDHAARRPQVGREERDRRRGLDADDERVATALTDALDERVLEPFPGGPRVTSDDERGCPVHVAEHEHAGPPEAVRDVLGELGARQDRGPRPCRTAVASRREATPELHASHDRPVHAVGELVRGHDLDILETRPLQLGVVLREGERSRDAPT